MAKQKTAIAWKIVEVLFYPVLNMIRESGHLVSEIEASDAKI